MLKEKCINECDMLKYHRQMTELQDNWNANNAASTNTFFFNWILTTMGLLHGVPYMFKLSKHNKNQINSDMYKQFESFFLLCFQESD